MVDEEFSVMLELGFIHVGTLGFEGGGRGRAEILLGSNAICPQIRDSSLLVMSLHIMIVLLLSM